MSNFIWYTGILLLSLVLWRVWQPTSGPDQKPRCEVATETGTASGRCTPQGVPYSTLPHMVNADGQYLFCRTWEPTLEPGQKPRALVFLNHGLGSHSGCIGPILAEMLNPHGFLIFAHDHAGNGQSEGERMLVDSLDTLTRDIFQHVDLMAAKYPGVPIFLVGASTGGALSITATVKRPGQFAGMVLMGPVTGLPFNSNLIWGLIWTLSKLIPNWVWEIPRDPRQVTSHDPTTERLEADPLRRHQRQMTIGLGIKFVYALAPLTELLPKVECPFLLMYGEDDKLTPVSSKLYNESKSEDKETKTYPNCRHALLLEDPEYLPEIKNDIVDWLLARVEPKKESA